MNSCCYDDPNCYKILCIVLYMAKVGCIVKHVQVCCLLAQKHSKNWAFGFQLARSRLRFELFNWQAALATKCLLEFSSFWFLPFVHLGAHFSIDRWWLCVLLRRWFIWPAWGQGQRFNGEQTAVELHGVRFSGRKCCPNRLSFLKHDDKPFSHALTIFLHFFYLQAPAIVCFLSSSPPITAPGEDVLAMPVDADNCLGAQVDFAWPRTGLEWNCQKASNCVEIWW